ncbi:MAG TPA: hypothetical protein VHQ65_00180 [Thermoanaerobaculia bacterium]|nr:hypothetical protein [Thermoanaerobaculia bacterium]
MNDTAVILIALVAVVVLGLLAVLLWRGARRRRLRQRFGPEYDHAVRSTGDRRRAEADLEGREKRVRSLDLRELDGAERERFDTRWRALQSRFVDQPSEAVAEADGLISEVMRARGYPDEDYRQRQADLSVEYPAEVREYRQALAIAGRNRRGEATTEDLRQAMVHYRNLFQHLLGTEGHDEPAREIA